MDRRPQEPELIIDGETTPDVVVAFYDVVEGVTAKTTDLRLAREEEGLCPRCGDLCGRSGYPLANCD